MISGERLDDFFEARVGKCGHPAAGDGEGRLLHYALIGSIGPTTGQAVRRPSLSHDGTPLVYSARIGSPDPGPYRLLVEPGGLHMPVSSQIAYSLALVDQILARLSWSAAATQLNLISTSIIDEDSDVVDRWWGGIWLGASVPRRGQPGGEADLRIYFNLRHGTADTRWRRVETIMRRLAGDDRPFDRWPEALMHHATPVGVAAVVASGALRGLRIYIVVPRHMADACADIEASEEDLRRLRSFCAEFDAQFGLADSVTQGWDFKVESGGLVPTPARVKTDLCCQLLGPEDKRNVIPWLSALMRKWQLPLDSLHDFSRDLDTHWGGSDIEFVGLGVTKRGSELTLYAKPHC